MPKLNLRRRCECCKRELIPGQYVCSCGEADFTARDRQLMRLMERRLQTPGWKVPRRVRGWAAVHEFLVPVLYGATFALMLLSVGRIFGRW